jgi:adenine-specific DNA-methyltransferase
VKIRGFSGQKPEKLLQRIFDLTTIKNDLVLDFFAGTGTTLAVAHKTGRQYIGIEQMDYIHDLPEARLKEVVKGEQSGISKDVNWQGGGSFIYCELAKWNEQAKDEINEAKDYKTLEKMFDTLYEKYFFNYNVKLKSLKRKF